MLLSDKIALVTGGASGIGRSTALAFAEAGAKVVVSDMNAAGGEETVHRIQTQGGGAIFVKTDVTKAAEVEALVAQAVSTYGRLDCAFNNAGVGGTLARTADRSEAEWDLTMNVNLKGVWLCMKVELQQMLKQPGGAIVNAASAAGLIGFQNASAYAASKHGVVGLTRSAALEYARKNIRINAVCPGFTETAMLGEWEASRPGVSEGIVAFNPMKRLAKPEEIAAAVVWLCSDAASFVTGHALSVDGGVVVQ
jgi:NAD(P)-dependent dehydrogenase (short-subunit alcohol dehydrogenase family)